MDVLKAVDERTSVTTKLLIATVVLYLIYDWWCHQYLQRRGIRVISYLPVIGSFLSMRNAAGSGYRELFKKHGRVFGWYFFRMPIIAVTDADMMKEILVRDFSSFVNRRPPGAGATALDKGLLSLQSDQWKEVRSVITPAFSAAKMRTMSFMINECCDTMLSNIQKAVETGTPVNCKALYGGFTMDTVAWCGFGLKVDSQKNKDDEFVINAQKAFKSIESGPLSLIRNLVPAARPFLDFFNVGTIPGDVTDFFKRVTQETCKIRNEGGGDLVNSRKIDLLQLMLNAHNEAPVEEDTEDKLQNIKHKRALTNEEVTAQSMIFFLAGYETTSSLLGFASYLLALNQDVQDRLCSEIEDVAPSRDLVGYDVVNKMTYLDMVISEALRCYPPGGGFVRMCNKPFSYKGLNIEKGTFVFMSIWGIHYDEEYWPEPEKFDPERFSPERKFSIQPCTYVPFGYGPRNCIGMRFALMEAKMALVRVLQTYRLDVCPETQIPIRLSQAAFSAPKEGIKLRAVPRK